MDYDNVSFDLSFTYGENGKSDLYTWMNPEPSNPFNINQNNSPTYDDNSIDSNILYYNSPSSLNLQNQQNSNNSLIENISEAQGYRENQEKFAQSTIAQKMEIEKEEPKEDIKDEEPKQDENKNIMDIEQTDLKNQQFINGNNININNDSLKNKLYLVEQIPIEENIKTKLFDYFTKTIEKITEGCDKISKKKEIILKLFEEEKDGKMKEELISILYPRRKDIIGNNDESAHIFNIPQYLEGLNSSPLKNKSDKKEMCITKIRKLFLTNLILNNNKDIHKKVMKKWNKKKKKKKKKDNNNSNNINKENNEKNMDSNLLYNNILIDEDQLNFSNYCNDKENQDNNEIIFQSSSFGNKSTDSNTIENVNNINEEDDEPIVRKDHLKNKLNISSKNEFIDKFNEVNISYQIEKKDDDESEEESNNEEDDRKEKNKIIINKNATNTEKKQNKNIIKLNININNKKKEKNEEKKEEEKKNKKEEKKYLAFFDSSWEETILEAKKSNPKFKDLNESEEAEEVMKMKRYKFLESLLNNEDKKKKFFDSQRKEYEEICKRDKCRIEANKIFENKNLDGLLIIVKYEKVRGVSINYKNKESFAEEIKKLKGFENFSLDLNDTDEKYITRHLEKLEKTANEIIKTLTEKNKHNEQSNNIIFE